MQSTKQPELSPDDIVTAPVNLSAPKAESKNETYEQLWEKFALVSEEKIELAAQLEQLKSAIRTNEKLDRLIEPYASRAFWFMCAYCSGTVAFLVAYLFGHELPESVLQVLVGSTAVTVIGLVGMVLTGIFVGARRKI